MELRSHFIPEEAVHLFGDIKMEPHKPSIDMENALNAEEYAINPSKTEIVPDTSLNSIDTNNANENENTSRSIHIPYILNGELFEIQTQDGENVTVKCCNCPPDRVYRGSVRSTGNFHMHIKRRHPDLMGKIYDMKVNALVERRDRFMKNRKSTRRRSLTTNRNRRQSLHNGQRMPCLAQPHSELFKIKAAFQRHQQQQQHRNQQVKLKQEQLKVEESPGVLHKWNMIDHFLVTPAFERAHNITLMDSYTEQPQPLNYSFKQCANEGTIVSFDQTSESTQEIIIKEADAPMNLQTNDMPMAVSINNEQIAEYGFLISPNSTNKLQGMTQNDENAVLHPSNSDQSLYGRATTISAVTPSPSDLSSYGQSPHNANSCTYDLKRNSNLATDTKRKICEVYGDDAVSERVVQIWFSKFRKGDTSCIDGQRTGRPGVADSDKVKMLIERYPHFTTKKIGELINMSEKTVADYLQSLGYVVDGDGWRYGESAVGKCNNNSNSNSNEESGNQPQQNINDVMDKVEQGVTDEEILVYCNKEFAYEHTVTLNNCNVQIIAPTTTEAYIITPRQQQPTVVSTDFPYIEYDSYEDMNEKGKENDNTGNTISNALPSFSEYFSNVYTSYVIGDTGNCAIEGKNINYVEIFNNSTYPLKSYE